ncbi:MAG: hypothetical protein CM1200mP5_5750 [Candidatus Pelagibacterales bacterium]|nr:MAG: hypothetical protein CM1200mP5_5750 [Pelagibacterales bacterium]
MGDGGFGMTISELSTAVEYKINTITIVMNNKSWGAEKAYQKDFYGKRYLGLILAVHLLIKLQSYMVLKVLRLKNFRNKPSS